MGLVALTWLRLYQPLLRADLPQSPINKRGADRLGLERLFPRRQRDFATWQGLDADAARLVWESSTGAVKLSDFAEEFFRRLADRLGRPMLLRKGELHRLVQLVDPTAVPGEVTAKLDLLADTFRAARRGEDA